MKKIFFWLVMILAAGLGGGKAYFDHQLQINWDKSIQAVADKVLVDYSQITSSLLGSIVIRHLQLLASGYEPLQVEKFTFERIYYFYNPYQLPPYLRFKVNQVRWEISDIAPPTPILMSAFGYAPYYITPRELRSLGYARIEADIELIIQPKTVEIQGLDSTKNQHVFFQATIHAGAWGEVELMMELAQVPVPVKWQTPTVWQEIQLIALTFSYLDKGLFNRLFTRLAQRNKMTLVELKQALLVKLKTDLAPMRAWLSPSVIASLQQFIQTPQQISLYLQPKPPLQLKEIETISLKNLGLKMATSDLKN